MRLSATALIVILAVSGASFAHVSRNTAKRNNLKLADPSYSSALAAANRFLHAWQTQDHETGIMMLTDSARQHASRERLQEFFSPGPNAAFEIQHGRLRRNGDYVFPTVLFGLSDGSSRAHPCSIVITKAGKDDWAVNRLP